MKKLSLVLAAALAATIAGLNAQAGSFETMLANPPQNVSGAPAVSGPSAVAPAGSRTAAPREWLVLVFINGVNDLGILGYAAQSVNFMEQVGSTDKMAVLVEFGVLGQFSMEERDLNFTRGSKTLYVTRDADWEKVTSPAIFTSNDSDMGSTANLVRFVKRGIRSYPAKKVAVIVWNHGNGRLGISYDDVSQNHMEIDQLGAALGQIKQTLGHKIDVFATDACYMQMAAVAYELKDSAEVIVGSEDIAPLVGFPYNMLLAKLAATPGMNGEGLGSVIVDTFGAFNRQEGVTLSAIRSSALPGFVAALNKWVGAVAADPQALKTAASQAVMDKVYKFYQMDDSKDLYGYIGSVNAALKASPAVKSTGVALQNYIKRNLLVRTTLARPKTYGLAIYIPELRYNSANYEKLAFAADSQWDDFLRLLMEERLK